MATRKKIGFSFSFESPITLIFVFICVFFSFLGKIKPEVANFLLCPTSATGELPFNFTSISDYVRLILYPLGFSNWNILTSNLVFILLLGPKVEEFFGKSILFLLIFVSIIFSGVICVCFSSTVMVGLSGIVCLLLILSFYTSIEKKDIPFSFVLLALIYFTNEINYIFSEKSLEVFYQFAGALISSLVGILSINSKK